MMHRKYTALYYFLATLPLLMAVLLYGYTLRLPLFLDDIFIFLNVRDINGIEQWGGSISFPYYRPTSFTIWKLSQVLADGYDPVALHWINVMFFGMTGVAVGQITLRLWRHNWLAMVLAGVGYIIFPFNYQSVTLVSSLFHVAQAWGISLSLWAGLKWLDNPTPSPLPMHGEGIKGRGQAATEYRRPKNVILILICWITGFLGVFSHENGVLLAPLAIGVLIARYYGKPRPAWRTIAPVVVIQVSLSILYLILWQFVPRAEKGDLQTSADLKTALAHLSQGLAYPFVALARLLMGDSDMPVVNLILGLVIAITLLVLGVLVWHSRKIALWAAYGAGWYLLAILPSAIFLPDVAYVLGSPRLMMLASAGGSIFWAVALAALTPPLPREGKANPTSYPLPMHGEGIKGRGLRLVKAPMQFLISYRSQFAPALLIIVTFFLSLNFLWARRHEFLLLGDYSWDLIGMIQRQDIQNDDQLLLVNAPNYLAPKDQTFLLGSEGSTLMLNGIAYNQLYRLNTNDAAAEPVDRALWYNQTLKHEGDSIFTPHDYPVEGAALIDIIKSMSYIITTNFDNGDFYPMFVGGSGVTGSDTPVITFTETGMTLNQFAAHLSEDHRTVTVLTRWHQEAPNPVKMFVHVFCGATYIEQSNGYFWGDMYPFALWQPGETLTDIRQIHLDEPIDPACLQVFTGVYWEANGVRLITRNEITGEQVYNDIIQITDVTITDEGF